MNIKRIQVGYFKNLDEITLDCSKMISLVSVNNYGKSNLLEGIKFGLDFITLSPKMRSARMHWRRGIPLTPALVGKDYFFSIEFEDTTLGEYRYIRYGYRFAWYNDIGTGGRITDEFLELRSTESVKYTSYLKRAENKYRSSKSTTAFRKLALSDDTLAIDVIGMVEDVDIADVVTAIKNISYRLCDSLELSDSFDPSPIEFDFGENVVLGNEDIPRMLATLMNKRPELYKLYLETIYDLFPEFSKVELQTLEVKGQDNLKALLLTNINSDSKEAKTAIPYHIRDELYRLVIKSNYLNQPISMEHMSTGTKRIFWLIANAVVSKYTNICLLGIDEVETSIHPRMIRNLLEALSEILGNTSMIVTSHSPYLIQYLKPESIYVGVPNSEGVAKFKRIQRKKLKSLINTTRNLEVSIGEYLFELMSGDDDSAKVLSSYLEDV